MAAAADRPTTTVSTKGQVILPKAVRDKKNWRPGTRLLVEETAEGVLLRAAPIFKPTTPDQVYGMLKYEGKPKTIKEIHDSIAAEVRRRHARGRY